MPMPPASFADKANGSFASIAHSSRTAVRNADSKRAARVKENAVLTAAADAKPATKTNARETWWVQARGSAFGPYSPAQLRQYVSEGRVKATSLVSTSRDGGWREARGAPELASLFSAPQPQTQAPGFTAQKADPASAETSNLFVFAEIHSGAWTQFLAALEAMGRIAELAPGFWLVRSKLSSGAVRNTLSQTLAQGDRFVVVDATRDRLAWFNMGPGPEVAIREVWNSELERRG